MQPLKLRGDTVALGSESARVGVEGNLEAEDPTARVGDQRREDRRVRHDHEPRPPGPEGSRGRDAAAQVAPEDRRAAARTGRVEADRVAADGRGDLAGPSLHRTPGEEADTAASVSVIVATHNRRDRIGPLARAVLEDPATLELVLVDDASSDGTDAVIAGLAESDPRIVGLVCCFARQLAALQAGVEIARGDVVLLLDDDVMPEPGLVTGHALRHRDGARQVVVGYMPVAAEMMDRAASRLYAAEYEATCERIEAGDTGVLDALWGGNVSLRRADALAIGLASAEFQLHYHADRELGYRLSAAGLAGTFDRALRARHLHRRDRDAWLNDARRAGAGLVELHATYPDVLGAFEVTSITGDLGGLLARTIGAVASSRHATAVCRGLWAGSVAARRCHLRRAETVLLRVARRIMRLHGAATQLSQPVPVPAPPR